MKQVFVVVVLIRVSLKQFYQQQVITVMFFAQDLLYVSYIQTHKSKRIKTIAYHKKKQNTVCMRHTHAYIPPLNLQLMYIMYNYNYYIYIGLWRWNSDRNIRFKQQRILFCIVFMLLDRNQSKFFTKFNLLSRISKLCKINVNQCTKCLLFKHCIL